MKIVNLMKYIDGTNCEDIEFHKWPVYYNQNCYQKSIEKVVNYLSVFREVLSIYQIGKISTPGISDIDLIVVFNDDVKRFKYSYRKIFNNTDNYLFMHGLFGMPLRIFKKRDFLIPIYNCKLIEGQEIISNACPPEEKSIVETMYSIEFLILNIFENVSNLITKRVKIRPFLCSINRIPDNIKTVTGRELDTVEKQFQDDILMLRKSGWEKANKEFRTTLFKTLKISIRLALRALLTFSSNYSKESSNSNNKYLLQFGPNFYLEPTEDNKLTAGKLILYTGVVSSSLNKLTSIITSRSLKKQICDFERAFSSISLSLPENLVGLLTGKTNDNYTEVYSKRLDILKDYYCFMNSISSEYGVFDHPRFFHLRQNMKWNVINAVNSQIFRKKFYYNDSYFSNPPVY